MYNNKGFVRILFLIFSLMATTHETLCWLRGICNGELSYSYLHIMRKLLFVS